MPNIGTKPYSMKFEVIGGGKRESACRDVLESRISAEGAGRVLILPIPSTRDGALVTGTDISLESLTASLVSGDVLCGYGLSHSLAGDLSERGVTVIDMCEDENFIEKNALLTAECTLSFIMSGSETALSDMHVGIVGYGRIGAALCEMLLYHGAHVTVYTRREQTRLELLFSGVSAELVAEARPKGLDLLVNTAPARLFSRAVIEAIDCEVLELASGNNLPWARKLTRLPSLPAKMRPKTAGRLYGEALLRAYEKGECK